MTRVRRRIGGGLFWFLCFALAGCQESKSPAPPKRPFQGAKLVAAVMGDQGILTGIQSQRGEWAASTGGELSFKAAPPADPKSVEGVDVLIFQGDRLGDLVDAGVLLALPEDVLKPPAPQEGGDASVEPPPDAFALKEIAPAYRDQVTKYGEDRVALPIGGTALVLAFQRAAFDREENKAAAKAAGITLEAPKTWAEFDALAKFFHGRDWDGDGKADSGVALAWAGDPEGVGNSTFLARAASLGQHRDQYSFLFDSDRMNPRIASPPFVEALGALVDLTKLGPPAAAKFDAEAARAAFRSGKVALLIDRAERAATWSEGQRPVGVAPLPGSDRVYNPDRKIWETPTTPNRPAYLPKGGGWLVGVVASTAHRDAAIDLAKYLAGPDVTNRLRSDRAFPMLATRSPQLAQGLGDPRSSPGVEARGWSDAVGRTVNAVRVVVGLRVPETEGYLADLTKGRLAALDGKPAEAALKDVAAAWDARIQALGRKRQTEHYRRSLTSLVTLPELPPRGK
jgi:multiple sugar transport system substrate-binding protein